MNREHFWLSAGQFARLKAPLPTNTRGKPRVDDRGVISGVVHVLKSGGRWVDAPTIYGPRKTLYNRFVRWAAKRRVGQDLPCSGRGWRTAGASPGRLLGSQGAPLCLWR
jgi:transposase